MHKVDVHLRNKGVFTFFANLDDPIEWLLALPSEEVYVGEDRLSNKQFLINLDDVTFVMVDKMEGSDAVKEGQESEDDQ